MEQKKSPEIQFPSDWEYRVFFTADKADGSGNAITEIVERMKLDGLKLEDGAVSKSGSYRTIRITVKVSSKEEAEQLGAALKNLPGVKFIL